ncbi:unnamed protein product [Prorocentrum cordatum]|uniref:WW domain-containing protein n=1 Tax=Prorocentrum cordatum TaxID=2364126 RepID=A0ABN9RX16_9DINO|nr:unnamed protein product [Polarella glacialis]
MEEPSAEVPQSEASAAGCAPAAGSEDGADPADADESASPGGPEPLVDLSVCLPEDILNARLLPGWEVAVDPSTGYPYYANRATGQSQWEPPVEEAPPAGPETGLEANARPRHPAGPEPGPGAAGPGALALQVHYPQSAAEHFSESFAHRLRWAHAVNSKRRLRGALAASAHFLEADVAAGPLTPAAQLYEAPPVSPGGDLSAPPPIQAPSRRGERGRLSGAAPTQETTSVLTASQQSVIMAHYPTEGSSDLSLERFVSAVLRHNERLDSGRDQHDIWFAEDVVDCEATPTGGASSSVSGATEGGPSLGAGAGHPMASRRRQPVLDVEPIGSAKDEAVAFAKDLTRELDDQAKVNGRVLTACVGSRRDHSSANSQTRRVRKGIKLDFKHFDCVEPTIRYLREIDAARRLGGHLWLNADVLAGPGALLSPLNAKEFVRLCAEQLPEAVLSLSWGASVISTTRLYTKEMVDRMIELCMEPFVNQSAAGDQEEVCLTPAATCNHITFAIAAEFALASSEQLRRLLNSVPGSSLTIFSGVGSLGITPAYVQELVVTYGKTRCFLDLRVSKPWRSCTTGNACSVQ